MFYNTNFCTIVSCLTIHEDVPMAEKLLNNAYKERTKSEFHQLLEQLHSSLLDLGEKDLVPEVNAVITEFITKEVKR